jgi:hypothetical protein
MSRGANDSVVHASVANTAGQLDPGVQLFHPGTMTRKHSARSGQRPLLRRKGSISNATELKVPKAVVNEAVSEEDAVTAAKNCSVTIKVTITIPTRSLLRKPTTSTFTAFGAAVTPQRAIFSLRADPSFVAVGETAVDVTTPQGVKLTGRISWLRYIAGLVDVAVVQLDEDCVFSHYVPVRSGPVRCGENVVVIGKDFILSDATCFVQRIDSTPNSAMIETTYYPIEGSFGPGIVCTRNTEQQNMCPHRFQVIGVHISSEQPVEGVAARSMKRHKSATRGPNGLCTMCAVAYVDGLVHYLSS